MATKETKKVESFGAFKLLTARLAAENEGVWLADLLVSVKIRPFNGRNKSLKREMSKLANGNLNDSEESFAKGVALLADHIVIDWDEAQFDGQKFDKDIFSDFCVAAEDTGFADDILAAAQDQGLFNQVARAKTEKN